MNPTRSKRQPASKPDPGRVLTQAALRTGELLGLQQNNLAVVLGVSAASVSRMKSGALLLESGTTSWQLAVLLVRLFRSLDSLTGGRDDLSRLWLDSDNGALGARPADLIRNIEGLVRTVHYLDAARARI